MRIVFASHSPFDEFLVVGSHHLAREISSMGHEVWHIGPPVTPAHFFLPQLQRYRQRISAALKGHTQLQPRLTSIEPISAVPWQLARLALGSGNRFVRHSNIARFTKKLPGMMKCDFLLVDDPRLAGIERILKPKSLFYRSTDLYAALKGDRAFIQAERLLLSRCDGVIATSYPVLRHALKIQPGYPSLLLTNGVDVNHFARAAPEPDDLKDVPHPRVIYVGALDDRFDVSLLAHLADQLTELQFIIIGPGKHLSRLHALGRKNVHVLGPRPYQQIPGYLQASELALMPLADDAANSGRSPMKLYESAAAGLPVVAFATDEISRREDRFVYLFSSREEAVAQIRRVLEEKPDRARIARLSEPHSWKAKATALLDFLKASAARKAASAQNGHAVPGS